MINELVDKLAQTNKGIIEMNEESSDEKENRNMNRMKPPKTSKVRSSNQELRELVSIIKKAKNDNSNLRQRPEISRVL